MALPLFEEIREARRLAGESAEASIHASRVDGVLIAIGILQARADAEPGFRCDLPGEDLIDPIADRWPTLADLRSADPRPGDEFALRLRRRRLQLELVAQTLRPLAATASYRAHHLHHLQEEQQHLLEHPRWAEDVRELQAIGAQRDRIVEQLAPIRLRLTTVEPARRVLETLYARLADEEALLRAELLAGSGLAWRTRSVMATLTGTLRDVLATLGLPVPVPEVARPEDAAAVDPAATLVELEALLRTYGAMLETLRAMGEALSREEAALAASFAAVNGQILDRLG